MTVEKNDIVKLQKLVEKRITQIELSPNPDSSELFDLNMLDSNISLLLMKAELEDGPIELTSVDKKIKDALKSFRTSIQEKESKPVDSTVMTEEILLAANEIVEMIRNLEDKVELHPEKTFAENLKKRLDHAQELLVQIALLKNESKKTLREWNTQIMPLPSSVAGTILGQMKTAKKAEASRENGKKGGRPRKNSGEQKKTSARKTESKIPVKSTAKKAEKTEKKAADSKRKAPQKKSAGQKKLKSASKK
ncbi:MAG: hypothetical protein PUJ70_07845 [Treponema sp.]|nr:hypothetical protein [Treponema sp.]MDY5837359.1 hypothetical protein [Treponema sp.]